MIRRLCVAGALLVALIPAALDAQEHPLVRRAQQAYDALDFSASIGSARAALQQQLTREDRILTYELLGFSYGALDSTRQAVEAFRQLIFLDPDREPDVERVSPRITSLYASALGQVLVVRQVSVDSTSFIAGQGFVRIRFGVTRASRAVTRVIGGGLDLVIDSALVVAGETQVLWDPVTVSGDPVRHRLRGEQPVRCAAGPEPDTLRRGYACASHEPSRVHGAAGVRDAWTVVAAAGDRTAVHRARGRRGRSAGESHPGGGGAQGAGRRQPAHVDRRSGVEPQEARSRARRGQHPVQPAAA